MHQDDLASLLRLVPPHWRVTLPAPGEESMRVDAGAFSATIAPYGARRYSFKIRAESGDKPTIYGYGMSLRQAFRAAAELMRNLCAAPGLERERKQAA